MADRLLIGVLGNQNSGKSHTWNKLFGRRVKTGTYSRCLDLGTGECVEVFLVSGSPEERRKDVADILGNQGCRIVLCSVQYTKGGSATLDHFIDEGFFLYVQWLNPGRNDQVKMRDKSLEDKILSARSVFSIRNGQVDASARVKEIREFIYGWAKYRSLLL